MQSVPTSRVLMVVALIMVISSPATSQPLNQQQLQALQQEVLEQRTRSIALLPQEWRKRAVEDLLSQLSSPDGDAVQVREAELVSRATGEGEVVSMVTEVEGGVAKDNLERSVDSSNALPPRDRKAGCKNFYWKGFTSC